MAQGGSSLAEIGLLVKRWEILAPADDAFELRAPGACGPEALLGREAEARLGGYRGDVAQLARAEDS